VPRPRLGKGRTVRVIVRLPEEDLEELRRFARERGLAVSEVVRRAVKAYMNVLGK